MLFYRGQWVVMDCVEEKGATLAGREFEKGDRISVEVRKGFITDGKEYHGGPWGWGRYSEKFIYGVADRIQDLRDFEIIWEADSEKVESVSTMLL